MARRRILLAEDDREMRRLVFEALLRDGYEVIEAGNGDDLRDLLEKEDMAIRRGGRGALDLIVTDVRLPARSGLEVIAWLRETRRDIPVVFMTAYGDRFVRVRAEGLGGFLLEKPFRIVELTIMVRALLSDRA